ncbi:MAG: hypothetical protein IT514_15500 [Burkholderiales bacterium]|nr:hypothetical protein [Burkholderiales bacterium]
MNKSEHDIGYEAGWINAASEALRLLKAHIDRLEPGRQRNIRFALETLESAVKTNLFVMRGIPWPEEFDTTQDDEHVPCPICAAVREQALDS